MKIVRNYKSKIVINKNLAATYIEKKRQLEILKKEVEDLENNLKNDIMPLMEQDNLKNVVSNGVSVSYVNGYVKNSIDSKLLKQEQPEIYDKYLKTSVTKSYVTLSITE